MTEKPRRLGRGLEALLGTSAAVSPTPSTAGGESQHEIDIELIKPNPYQPRREFGVEELRELETSLRANGLLQPVTVRPSLHGFELVAGERRLRAASRLGWRTIPAIVRQLDEQEMLIELDPELFYKPRYLGPWGWVGLRIGQREFDWSQAESRIEMSWMLTATPFQRARYGQGMDIPSG